jgi:hypothetical protein
MFGSPHAVVPENRYPSPGPRRGTVRLIWFAVLAVLSSLLYVGAVAGTAQAAEPGTPSGWATIFSDDFNGPAGIAPASSNWMFDTGAGSSFGTGEIETMTNSTANTYLDGNGNLDITALGSGGSWTSGRIQTTSANVGAPAGGKLEVVASIQQPSPSSGLGYWPAFWMLGPGQWPENGEIDIMEDVNALSDVAGTIHCGVYPGGVCNEGTGLTSGLRSCPGCQSGFHTYSMILDRTDTSNESITFYLDGGAYFSVSESQVGASTWRAAFDHNLSIIFDLAMGGNFPNGACGCTTPTGSTSSGATMSVDYVAAYTTGGAIGTTYQALPGTWSHCADEGGTCAVNSASVIAFGTSGRFNYVGTSASTSCAVGVFGDPDLGVVKSCYVQTAPPPTNIWTPCASENGTCSYSGVMTVAFGANGSYNYATLGGGGTACTDAVFGDPAIGTAKSCYVMGAPPSFTTWTSCSGENGTCSFSGTHEVAYGVNGEYVYGIFSGSAACNNGVFGDPAYGSVKTCYVQ